MRLAVTADDYGLTPGIARGIIEAHQEGVVTSTSVLTVGPAFDDVVGWLGDAPDLHVGLHLAAVGEDAPLLSAREIPTLVDGRGRLPRSWRQLVRRLALHRVDPADLDREFEAQYQRLRAAGWHPTHLNTHQHLHLWPTVADVVLALAHRHDVAVVRAPSAPRSVLGPGVGLLAGGLRRRVRAAGCQSPDIVVGLAGAGRMHGLTFERTVRRLAARRPARAELVVHPGAGGDDGRARYDWGYHWEQELACLTAGATRQLIEDLGFTLTGAGEASPG